MLPWNEDELAPETSQVSEDLVELNRTGVLTINSQPHVNAAKSTDPVFGWGGAGGYVYQKVLHSLLYCGLQICRDQICNIFS
jgi:methylenetetrahydrofolate reductase (NADPH)